MTRRTPIFLIATAAAACAPHTTASRPDPHPTLTAAELNAVACARTQALALGFNENTSNNVFSKAYDDGGRQAWDMLAFRIADAKLVVSVVGSPSHTPPSSEGRLAKDQIERRCSV